MTWSTRELADRAGTTVNTVRHYHRLGLLEEPQRRYNGYKQYGVHDLVRLLRIRRLAELSLPLSQIGQGSASGVSAADELRTVDSELERKIAQLQRARADIATILQENAPADAPAGFASVAARLSEADSAIIHIYTQLYDAEAMADVRRMVEVDAEEAALGEQIAALPADADDPTRQGLAERLAPTLARNLAEYPWLQDPSSHLSTSIHLAQETIIEAVSDLYNDAQRDVFARAGALALDAAASGRAELAMPDDRLGAA